MPEPRPAHPPPPPAEEDGRRRLREMLRDHRVLHLCTVGEGAPWAAPLYFALEPERRGEGHARCRVLFASSPRSRHVQDLASSPDVAASLGTAPDDVAALRGAQLRGRAAPISDDQLPSAREVYLTAFPFARPLLDEGRHALYRVDVTWAKLTDNRLGFGHKTELRLDTP